MKKLFSLIFTFWASLASANVSCTVPFNLQNNTLADATQVMANYNALIACLANAAAAGSNTDITALLGLSTPLGSSFGGTSSFIGGTSSGTNAQVVTVTPTASFSLTTGYKVSFTVGSSNTSTPTTLNVNSTGAVNVSRHTQFGISNFIGGEWVAGQRVMVEYDGTNWQWVGVPPIIVGTVYDFAGTTCPNTTFTANNQAVSRSLLPDLFSALGTTWGAGNGSTTFNLPDLRGRAGYGQESGGSNRITVAGGNFDGTVIGNVGGLQNHTMTTGELVAHSHSITDVQHSHVEQISNAGGGSGVAATANSNNVGVTTTTQSSFTGITTTNSNGSTTPFTVLAPAAIVSKCIQG